MKKNTNRSNFKPSIKNDTLENTDFQKWSRILLLWMGVILLLGIFKNDLIARIFELDVFIPDVESTTWNQPGGFLLMISNILTTCCYYPVLGLLALLAVGVALQWLVWRVLGGKFTVISFIPSMLAVLFVTRLDYSIYLLKTPGILFLLPVGICFSLCMLYVFQRIKSLRLKIIYLCMASFIGFDFVGFFAFLAVGLMILWEWKMQDKHKYLFTLLGVAVIGMVPLCYYLWIDRVRCAYLYFSGLPFMDFSNNGTLFIPLIISILSACLLVFDKFQAKLKNRTENILVMLLIGVLYGGSYWDRNFHAQLKMERAIDVEAWQSVLDIARKNENPSRPMVAYRNIALLHKGCIADSMFTYPEGSEPLCTSEQISTTQICATRLYFHFGQANYSARWAMEMATMRGKNIQWIKTLVKTAIYNGETKLAQKYLQALRRIPWMGDFCDRYEGYMNQPETLKKDAEYGVIKQLTKYKQTEFISSDVAETELLDHFAIMEGGTPQMLEMSILSVLQTKQMTPFWSKFNYYLQTKRGKLSRHFLEAAVLFAYFDESLTPNSRNNVVNLVRAHAPRLLPSFETFKKMMLQYEENPNDTLKAQIKEIFGQTYWYFFFLSGELETN